MLTLRLLIHSHVALFLCACIHTCSTFVSPVCTHVMDLVFALDSSSDVSADQWTQQKFFMSKAANAFQVQESGTHAGVVAYSTIPSISMKLGERNVKEEVDKTFNDLPRDPGNRNLVGNVGDRVCVETAMLGIL